MFSSDETRTRAKILASKGYFPGELPPVFRTTTFGENIESIIHEWYKYNIVKTETKTIKYGKKTFPKSNAYTYNVGAFEPDTVSKPKRQYERRNLDVVHPVPQAFLIYEIAENFRRLSKQLSQNCYSLDKVTISDKYSRGVAHINFDAHKAKKDFIEHSSDWLVRTDISRFYPSIYTHSISWSLYGKEDVKSDIAKFRGSVGDRLDQLIRSGNRNQTIGIPIGPETSRILAECISSSIDHYIAEHRKKLRSGKVDRMQDDWFIGCGHLEKSRELAGSW